MFFKDPEKVSNIRHNARASRRRNQEIFIDKVVDRRREPTLFNIEAARAAVAQRTGPHPNLRSMRAAPGRKTNRAQTAREVLFAMNVSITDIDSDFSLLECNSNKETIDSQYIFDKKEFSNTVNNLVLATDKFVSVDDPFYQLDDGPSLVKDYKIPKSDTTKEIFVQSDPSFVLSNMTILNQSKNYFGKNKYF